MAWYRKTLQLFAPMLLLLAGTVSAAELPAGPLRDALERRYPHAAQWEISSDHVERLPAQYELVRTGHRSAVRGQDGATVWVEVQGMARVAVLSRVVAKGNALQPHDVSWVMRDITLASCDPVASLPERESLVVAASYRAGEVLCARDIATAPVVSRGQRITLLVRVAGVSVEAEGVAQNDAQAGERVRVRAASGEQLVGVAQSPARVVVDAI
jgi:flagella basal body P-ring formation protein FlgA